MKILGFIRCCFWRCAYTVVPYKRNFGTWWKFMQRTENPYTKFKPYCYYSVEGAKWHIYFTQDCDYVARMEIKVDAHISQETGEIVGLSINREDLKDANNRSPA